jgi:hypothetical protein
VITKEYKIFDLNEGEIEDVIKSTNEKGKECWYDIGYIFRNKLTLKILDKIKDKVEISDDWIS